MAILQQRYLHVHERAHIKGWMIKSIVIACAYQLCDGLVELYLFLCCILMAQLLVQVGGWRIWVIHKHTPKHVCLWEALLKHTQLVQIQAGNPSPVVVWERVHHQLFCWRGCAQFVHNYCEKYHAPHEQFLLHTLQLVGEVAMTLAPTWQLFCPFQAKQPACKVEHVSLTTSYVHVPIGGKGTKMEVDCYVIGHKNLVVSLHSRPSQSTMEHMH